MSGFKWGMWLQASKNLSLLYWVWINPNQKILLGSSILNLEPLIQITSVLNVLQLHVQTARFGECEQQLAAEMALLQLQKGNARKNVLECDSSY